MVSKILIKLIDYSIFPAVITVAAKIIGIIFFLNYFNSEYTMQGISVVLENNENFLAVNSYSSLLMVTVILSGLIWVIFKAHVLHNTHISPFLSAKLYNMDLEDLVSGTKTIYTQSFIWLSYMWLLTLVFGVQSYFELSYIWLFYLSLALSVLASVFLIVDIERELIQDKKNMKGNDKKKTKVLNIESLKEVVFS